MSASKRPLFKHRTVCVRRSALVRSENMCFNVNIQRNFIECLRVLKFIAPSSAFVDVPPLAIIYKWFDWSGYQIVQIFISIFIKWKCRFQWFCSGGNSIEAPAAHFAMEKIVFSFFFWPFFVSPLQLRFSCNEISNGWRAPRVHRNVIDPLLLVRRHRRNH